MSGLSPAEIITRSFYAWEMRGRGWGLAPYPVSLEPPFRYFHIQEGLIAERRVIDDGRRPTFLSSLVEGVIEAFREPKAPLPAPEPIEEDEAPFPAEYRIPRVAFSILLHEREEVKPKVMRELLSALGSALHPLSLDIVGAEGGVRMQLTCAEADSERVFSLLSSYAPEASVVEAEPLVSALWDEDAPHTVVDFGLSEEFFLPLPGRDTFPLDPYVPLIPALARAGPQEFVAVSILFEGVRNPWGKAIRRAVQDGEGGCLFLDAPEFLKRAEEKTRPRLFAVSLRVAAQAEDEPRAWDLAKGAGVFVRQFGHPGGNELLPLDNAGYPDGAHAWAFREYQSFRTGMILSAEELAALAHFPDPSLRDPALLRDTRKTKALPPEALGHPLVLGLNAHRGKEANATLDTESRLKHTWLIGASGSGKSNLLLSLILQDVIAGEGVAVLDPHGDLIDDILGQIPKGRHGDVVLFDPSDAEFPVGWNVLSAESEVEKTLLASDLVGVFRRLSTSFGDTMGTVLGNAVLAILESEGGGTLLDLRRLLVDERFRKRFLGTVADQDIRFFWEREYPMIGSRSVGPILTRLDTFLRPKLIRHIVGQREGKLDLGAVMAGRKIFLAKLSQGLIGEENAYLLGSLLLGKFQELALSRQQLAKEARTPFFLYADEFQNFITPTLETLLSGVRKYGLGLTLAHQTLAQLSALPRVESALFGNAHTRIVFRVGEGDARKLAEGFSSFEAEDLVRLGRGEALVRLGTAQQDFNLKTYPAPRFQDGEEGEARERVVELSRARYGTAREAVMASLAVPVEEGSQEGAIPGIEKTLASAINAETAPQEEEAGIGASKPDPATKKKSEAKQEKQRAVPESLPSGRGGQEHKYLQHLVKRLAEERGFRAAIEEAAGEGRADVVLRKESFSVAVEISITTDADHETENVRKCQAAGFTQVLFVSPDTRRLREITKRLGEASPKVLVCRPEEIAGMLDALDPGPLTTESTVRGYKVKVTRQKMSPEDAASRRLAVAAVIAKSMGKSKKA